MTTGPSASPRFRGRHQAQTPRGRRHAALRAPRPRMEQTMFLSLRNLAMRKGTASIGRTSMQQNVHDGVGLEQALKSGELEKHGVVPTGTVKSSEKPHHFGFMRRRTPRHSFLPRPVLAAAVMLAALHVPGMASAQLLLTVDHGFSWDPLVGANPMFNFPGEIRSTAVSVREAPFGPGQFTGPVRLSAECCKDALTRSPIVPAGLSVEVTCEFMGRIEAPALRTDIVRPPGRPDLPVLPCPSLHVRPRPGRRRSRSLRPGRWRAPSSA